MMRAMREITKPVFWVVAVSFIGWMAYGQITDIVGGGRDVVLKVDGTIVRSQPFQQQYQATLEQYRRQQGGGRLSREDERQVQDRVADQCIQKILLDPVPVARPRGSAAPLPPAVRTVPRSPEHRKSTR